MFATYIYVYVCSNRHSGVTLVTDRLVRVLSGDLRITNQLIPSGRATLENSSNLLSDPHPLSSAADAREEIAAAEANLTVCNTQIENADYW